MKLQNISSLNFNGKIIDSHAHLGNWCGVNYQKESLDVFIKSPLSNGDTIEKIIVSNADCLTCAKNEIEGNLEILKISTSSPKIIPLAVCQPKTGNVSNIKKLFSDNPNKFIGLKFHPDEHKIIASNEAFLPYLKFAEEKNLPCLFHCGIAWQDGKLVSENLQYSAPDEIYKIAQKVPNTPVIMAHLGAGGEKVHTKAIDVLLDSIETTKANLYADISWVDIDNPEKPTIVSLLKKLQSSPKGDMTSRILFGSDAPIAEFTNGKDNLNGKQFYEKTISDIKCAIKNNFGDKADELIEKVFYKNAENLFFKDTKVCDIASDKIVKTTKKTKIGLILVGIFAFITCGILTLLKSKKSKNINYMAD